MKYSISARRLERIDHHRLGGDRHQPVLLNGNPGHPDQFGKPLGIVLDRLGHLLGRVTDRPGANVVRALF